MSNYSRGYPGALSAGTGLTFRTNLNADRVTLYGHTDALQRAMETIASIFNKGTSIDNTVELYVDSNNVYCPIGYRAIINNMPVETTTELSQGYASGILSHVYLVLDSYGAASSLRVATGTVEEDDNELWVADITSEGQIDNTPDGKQYAYILPTILPVELSHIVSSVEFTIGTESDDTINVAVQAFGLTGEPLVDAYKANVWLSSAESYTIVPADGISEGTNGTIIHSHIANGYIEVIFDNGVFDLNITESDTTTYYMNVELQNRVFISSAITFN